MIDPDNLTGNAGTPCEYENPMAWLLSRSLTSDCQVEFFILMAWR